MPDTRWTVESTDGDVVKESVGALPTHILATGKDVVTAASGGHLFHNTFEIKDGDVLNVEVLMTAGSEDSGASSGATDVAPSVGGTGNAGGSTGGNTSFSTPSLGLRNP